MAQPKEISGKRVQFYRFQEMHRRRVCEGFLSGEIRRVREMEGGLSGNYGSYSSTIHKRISCYRYGVVVRFEDSFYYIRMGVVLHKDVL